MEKIIWETITEQSDSNYLDFSVNTNQLGLPAAVSQNISQLINIGGFYPDTDCNVLSAVLATKYNLSSTHFLCGNGADDLLYRLIFAVKPNAALIVEPTFEEYNRALELVNCKVCRHQLNPSKQFGLDEGILPAITKELDMMFLCNPNNPTGNLVNIRLLGDIIDKCQKENVLLVVDECFIEFIPEWQTYSVKQRAAACSNLIVFDAFTKTYSLAGFRLGFCVSGNNALLKAMKLQGQDYAVSVPAQFAGICALMDERYLQDTYVFLEAERTWLYSQFYALGIEVWPSRGNFLLLKTSHMNLRQKLLKKGIKVRDCSRFYGLGPEYCRVVVRQHSENIKLIEAIKVIL